MYNLDSLSLKYLIKENEDFLNGAVIQKIQMPSKREILLSVRNLGENKKLYINVNPKFAHMNFISNKENYAINIPKEPPMFCMLLRKYLEGAKLKEVKTVEYERIVEFYFDVFDEIGSLNPMCLSVEFMGKHSNVILYNAKNKIIAGSVHNISPEKSSVREVWGGIEYIYPPKQEKKDILKTSIADFYNLDVKDIPARYYYISGGLAEFILRRFSGFQKKDGLFSYIQNMVLENSAPIKDFWTENIQKEGIALCLPSIKDGNQDRTDITRKMNSDKTDTNETQTCKTTDTTDLQPLNEGNYQLKEVYEDYLSAETNIEPVNMVDIKMNYLIEKYFSHFVMKDLMENKKAGLRRVLAKEIKRYKDIILNSDKKNSYLLHKQKGDLILANIYNIKKGDKKVVLDGIEIILDETKSPAENAQRYFSLYSKGKTAKEIGEKRKEAAEKNLEYLNDILFSVGNADKPGILDEIEDEIDIFLRQAQERLNETDLDKDRGFNNKTAKNNSGKPNGAAGFKGKNRTRGEKNEKQSKLAIETIEYQGFQIYIGKNNKQNDYLIKKVSNPEDIWLHAKDCPSGHIFIKTENGKKTVSDDVLLYAAKLAKANSPMKESAKASIIYTKRKFLKRPPDTHLGYVTYREEREIVV